MKLQNQAAASLHQVVTLRSPTACVEHYLGELVSRRGIML
jgi:hypothetical protein